METAWVVALACIFVFTATGLVCDLRTRKLPNLLTVPAFCAGLLFHAANGLWLSGLSGTAHGILFAFWGFATGFGLILVLWFIGGAGGGDVKFMGALGAWLGAWLTVQVLVLSAVLSGVFTTVILVRRVFGLKRLRSGQPNARAQREKKRKNSAWTRSLRSREGWVVPFGATAAVGTWIVLALELTGHGIPWPPVH